MHIRSVAIEYTNQPNSTSNQRETSSANSPMPPEQYASKLTILSQEYNIDETKMKFKLKDNYGHIFTTTAAEISANDAMIHALSKRELNMISYIAGYEASNAWPNE